MMSMRLIRDVHSRMLIDTFCISSQACMQMYSISVSERCPHC